MSLDSPQVESFVLRFVHDAPADSASSDTPAWRGMVVHVQSNTEANFTDFADAVAFIARYVPIGDFVFTTTEARPRTENIGHPSSVLGQSGE